MLDEKEIEQYLNEKGVGFRDESSIVGVIMPNKITYFAGENAESSDTKNCPISAFRNNCMEDRKRGIYHGN